MINGQLAASSEADIPFPVDTFNAVCLYSPEGSSVEIVVTLSNAKASTWGVAVKGPQTEKFPHTGVVGVALFNKGTHPVGWSLVTV